jgi:hypothetical protein
MKVWTLLLALCPFSPAARAAMSVTVDWDANPAGDNVTGYRLYYATTSLIGVSTAAASALASPSGPVFTINAGNTLSCPVNGLNGPATYYFRLTAYKASSEDSVFNLDGSGFETEISTFVPGSGAPSAPSAPSGVAAAAVSSSEIDLSWSYSGVTPTGFIVEWSLASGGPFTPIQIANAAARSYPHTGLPSGVLYFYRVRAYNGAGSSAPSGQVSKQTLGGAGQSSTGGNPLLLLEQKLLTPGRLDGVNDAVDFGSGASEVQVLDTRGRLVFEGRSAGSSLVWNCSDSRGAVARSGLYVAKVTGKDGSVKYQKLLIVK